MHKSLRDIVRYLYDNDAVTYTELIVVARRTKSKMMDSKGKGTLTQKSAVMTDVGKSNELESLRQQVATLKAMITKDPKKGGNRDQYNGNKGQNRKTVVMNPGLIAKPPTATAHGLFPMANNATNVSDGDMVGVPHKGNLIVGGTGRRCSLPTIENGWGGSEPTTSDTG